RAVAARVAPRLPDHVLGRGGIGQSHVSWRNGLVERDPLEHDADVGGTAPARTQAYRLLIADHGLERVDVQAFRNRGDPGIAGGEREDAPDPPPIAPRRVHLNPAD